MKVCLISNRLVLAFAVLLASSLASSLAQGQSNPSCQALSPVPTGVPCGSRGTVLQSNTGATNCTSDARLVGGLVTTSFSQCQSLCFDRVSTASDTAGTCGSFLYNQTSSLCSLYGGLASKCFVKDSKSSAVFYDIQCYKCTQTCPDTRTENLYSNGDFELSSRYFGPVKNSAGGDPQPFISYGHNSQRGLVCTHQCYLELFRDFCVGQYYTFQADYLLVVNTSATSQSGLYAYAYVNELGITIDTVSNGTWQTIGATFTGPELGRVLIAFGGTGYTLFLDNIVIRPVAGAFKAAGTSLLTNGGFESGSLSPWKFQYTSPSNTDGTYSVTTPGLTQGKHKFDFSSPSYYQGLAYVGFTLSQAFTTVPGNYYVLTFDYVNFPTPDRNDPSTVGSARVNAVSWTFDTTASNSTMHFAQTFRADSKSQTVSILVALMGFDVNLVQHTLVDNVRIRKLA